MRAILDFAAKNLGIKRVAGGHAKENLASAKVIEKLGFIDDRDDITLTFFLNKIYYTMLHTFSPV